MKFIVLTGGPGAGKTAVLEMAKRHGFMDTAFVPESASMIFKGGFWRLESVTAQMAAQRAIYHVQRQMERLVLEEAKWKFALCDRGTLDGLAYWPGSENLFWRDLGSTRAHELARYATVIHLRTPDANEGYNFENSLRIETAEQARAIDRKIQDIWAGHPKYYQVGNSSTFLEKARHALALIELALSGETTL